MTAGHKIYNCKESQFEHQPPHHLNFTITHARPICTITSAELKFPSKSTGKKGKINKSSRDSRRCLIQHPHCWIIEPTGHWPLHIIEQNSVGNLHDAVLPHLFIRQKTKADRLNIFRAPLQHPKKKFKTPPSRREADPNS